MQIEITPALSISARPTGLDRIHACLEVWPSGHTADINTYIGSTPYKGLLKTYQYQPDGELQGGGDIIQHEVKSGKIALVGPVK